MTTKSFKHASCNGNLNITSLDPKPNDKVICAKCGLEVQYSVFKREIDEYLADQASEALSKSMREATRGLKGMTFKESHRPKRNHRFVVEGGIGR